jgi:hypothetical protein
MWPYDYFNQFSNIEIDNKIGLKKKVFLAIWYGGKLKRGKQDKKRHAFKEFINNLEIEGIRFDPVIAEDIKKSDFNTNILSEIIQSTFVVCDVTPTDDYVPSKNKEINDAVFNPNVMVELGLALAWKMPEQVIVLWEGNDKRFPEGLASDIHNYHVDKIDAQYKGLGEIIKNRLKQFEYKKDILVKNVKSKIDEHSLSLVGGLHGLLFTLTQKNELSFLHHAHIARIRHLLNLGIIRIEIFPGSLHFAYCLTGIGKIVLTSLGVKLYPDILIDTYLLIHWKVYLKEFKAKYKDFKKAYDCDIKFEKLIDEFLDFIEENNRKKVISSLPKKYRNLDVFYKYLNIFGHDFDFVNKDLISKIAKSNKSYSRFFRSEKSN